MDHDYRTLLWDEVDDIGALLHDLERQEWDAPSLCEGWRVRDVVGHMEYGHTRHLGGAALDLVRQRFDLVAGSSALSVEWATRHRPDELLAIWDHDLVEVRTRRGVSRFVKWPAALVDHLIHHQDMRRPLGRARTIPPERLRAALDALGLIHSPLFDTRDRVEGFRLVATDLDWSRGAGPEVAGPAEALLLAAGGRSVAYADLDGAGLAAFVGAASLR